MRMNEIWKAEGAGPQETSEGLRVKVPEISKGKRLVRTVIAVVCLMLTCFPVGDLPAAWAGGYRRGRTRRYVVERTVVIRERCVRTKTVRVRRRYVPCRRRVVKPRRCRCWCAPRRRVARRRPAQVSVWRNTRCGRRLVYRGSARGVDVVIR